MKNNVKIIFIGIALVIFGVLAIYSVSIYESFKLTLIMQKKGNIANPSNYYYFFKQMINLVIGLVVAFLAYKVKLEKIEKYAPRIFIFAFLFQLLVFTPIGIELNGARGWLYLGPLGTVQPSEIFKLAFVMFFAGWFIKKRQILSSLNGFFVFLVSLGIILGIFLLIPDLGTVLVLGPVALILYWYAGGKLRYVLGLISIGFFLGVTVGMQFNYIRQRLEYFINPDFDTSGRGVGWQTKQALVAVGGGGLIGKGYGKGLQKFGYIPEAQSDFIFASISEEIGFIGDVVLLLLYLGLGYYFLRDLDDIKNIYCKILGVGVISLLLFQVFINVGVNIKIVPLTGMTLPFVSFGGTALMINFIEIVLLYNIMQQRKFSETIALQKDMGKKDIVRPDGFNI